MLLCHRNYKFHLLIAALLNCFVFLIFSNKSIAAGVDKYGVHFNIEKQESRGSGLVLIKLADSEQLVSEVRISQVVIREYLTTQSLFEKLSNSDVSSFVNQACQKEDRDNCYLSLSAILRLADSNKEGFESLLDSIPNGVFAVSSMKELLLKEDLQKSNNSVLSRLLITISRDDINWVKANLSSTLFSNLREIKASLRSWIFSAITKQNLLEAKDLLELQKKIVGDVDPEVNSLNLLLEKINSLDRQADFIETLSSIVESDKELYKLIGPLLVDLIHKKSKQLLDSHEYLHSLNVLCSMDFNKRTPETHQLFKQILQQFPFSDLLRLSEDIKKKDILEKLSDKDHDFKEIYINRIVQALIDQQNSSWYTQESYDALWSLLVSVRADPNSLNDQFRVDLVRKARLSNLKEAGEYILTTIKTEISTYDQFILFLSWLKFQKLAISLVLLVVIAFILYLMFLILKSSALPAKSHNLDSIQEAYQGAPFVKNRSTSKQYPNEYISALSALGLTTNSTLAEIKSAYRAKMKNIHPDLKKSTGKDPQEFVYIKDVYDKILDFRKRLGLDT